MVTISRKQILVSVGIVALVTTATSLSVSQSTLSAGSPPSFRDRLLVRQIRSQPTNLTHALDVLTELDRHHSDVIGINHDDNDNGRGHLRLQQSVVVEALRVCGRVGRPDVALQLYEAHPSDDTLAVTISVLGHCQQHLVAVKLLEQRRDRRSADNDGDSECDGEDGRIGAPETAAPYNAAIAACGRAKDWERALDIYTQTMPHEFISTLTTNALLTTLANCRQGTKALEVLRGQQQQQQRNSGGDIGTTGTVDGVSFRLVVSALVRSGELSDACTVLEDLTERIQREREQSRSLQQQGLFISTNLAESMFDLVLAAYSQRADWRGVQRVERIRHKFLGGQEGMVLKDGPNEAGNSSLMETQERYQFQPWTGLEKVGRGKESYFLLGTYGLLNITIGVHPHRNAAKNGIQLLFFQNQVDNDNQWTTRRKLGYLLMQNSADDRTSSLLGMYLTPGQRGQGIAKHCLAIWIKLCLDASIVPLTGVIQKPLLALTLQQTFGFVPKLGGVPVEVCRDPNDPASVVLYSPSLKSLEGAFSPWDLQHQHIKIVSQAPEVRGRTVRIGSKFDPPNDLTFLGDRCQDVIGRDGMTSDLTKQDIQRVFLGKCLELA